MTDLGDAFSWLLQLSAVLAIVGAINWGLVGLFDVNLVTMAVGDWPMVERAVYALVGVGGVSAAWKLLE